MKKLLIFLVSLSVLFVCGCSSNNDGKISTVDGMDIIEYGKRDNAKYLLQIDINPSLIVGYADNEEVVYIVSNNKDGFELLEKHKENGILGERLENAIGTIMTAAHEDGYEAENFDVEIKFVSEEKGNVGDIAEITRQAVKKCNFDVKAIVENKNEIIYSNENGIIENLISENDNNDTNICNVCNGEGIIICKKCNGKGETTITVQRQKEVRNNYVCEICGGKGWIDDGMHGGEKGNCDSCGGLEGKMPSGDFREKAYDLVMVGEEEMRKCDECDGSCETECWQCGGKGTID